MNNQQQVVGILKKILRDKGMQENEIAEHLNESAVNSRGFFHYCFDKDIILEDELIDIITKNFNFEYIDVLSIEDNALPKIERFTESIFFNYNFIPVFYNDKKISIATSNPFNEELIRELKTVLNVSVVEVYISKYSDINTKLNKYLEDGYGIEEFDENELNDLDFDLGQDDKEEDDSNQNNAPIVKFVHKMLLDAIKVGASDLHFEPYEYTYRIRFRIDGILKEISTQKITIKNHVAARLKVMSGMDIAEKRKPQDGRIKIKYGRENIDFRVNSLPTLFGEKLVLRILDSNNAKMGIENLGYDKEQKDLYLEALDKPQGMILVTGPTGSGKTVSLYTGLNLLNDETKNISTAEDPVEINLTGINQVQINNKSGMTFASALRSFLRQDPDIIMVGEIRDLETAEISIKAAQTGHMVMSTLHTNSAAETITRLKNMGVASYNVANSLNLIIAQRLVRRLCPHCKEKLDMNSSSLKEMGFTDSDIDNGVVIYDANKNGCNKCSNGYKGRAGVYEVVKVTKPISKLILNNADTMELNKIFQEEGFYDLRRAALLKVKEGITSLSEVNRVTIE